MRHSLRLVDTPRVDAHLAKPVRARWLMVAALMLLLWELGLATAAQAASAASPIFSLPPSATLRYASYISGVRNQDGGIRWNTDGRAYTLAVEVPLPLFLGAAVFRSVGAVDARGLAPQRYEETRGRRPPDLTIFHRDAEPSISFTRTAAVLPLPPGVQDRFSVFLQLTGLARGNPSRLTAPGATFDIPIADTDSVEIARVQHAGEDTIDTPGGPMRAHHFVRLPRREGDARRVEIWLSAEHGWLPVRLRQTEPNGIWFELVYLSQDAGSSAGP